jgi:hypothetical protein
VGGPADAKANQDEESNASSDLKRMKKVKQEK